MSDLIFAQTRHFYESYRDFWSLVRLSGYPVVYVDEIDVHDAGKTYIITPFNGEWERGWPDVQARLVWWDLEWRVGETFPQVPGVSDVWVSDLWYASLTGARYVTLGSHPGLRLDGVARFAPLFDVVMLAYMTNRRQEIAGQLARYGLRLAPGGWNETRDGILKSSRVMLHVHQRDDTPTVAPLRFALAAAYHLPLLSEAVAEPGPFADCVEWADFSGLSNMVINQLHNGVAEQGEALYQLLCVDRPFRTCVSEALER